MGSGLLQSGTADRRASSPEMATTFLPDIAGQFGRLARFFH
jgi:hypothetical protein